MWGRAWSVHSLSQDLRMSTNPEPPWTLYFGGLHEVSSHRHHRSLNQHLLCRIGGGTESSKLSINGLVFLVTSSHLIRTKDSHHPWCSKGFRSFVLRTRVNINWTKGTPTAHIRKSQEFWEQCVRNQGQGLIYPVISHRGNTRSAWQVVPESKEVKKPMDYAIWNIQEPTWKLPVPQTGTSWARKLTIITK